jgi:hypothetical protein
MYFVQEIVENVEIFVENNNFPSLMCISHDGIPSQGTRALATAVYQHLQYG